MSFLFGSAPSVQTTTQPTISPTQENILNTTAGYLQSGDVAPGATTGAPTGLGQIAPGLSDLQNLSLSGFSNLFTNILPSILSQFNPVGSAQAATTAYGNALGYQGPGTVTPSDVSAGMVATPAPVQLPGGPAPVTAPQATAPANVAAPNAVAPQIDIGQAIQQGVVSPATQLWNQTLLPGITGKYGQGAGGAFSSDAEQARLQAGEQLETGVEAQSSALEQQLKQSNLAAQLQTQGLNVGGALQAALANQSTGLSTALANQGATLSAALANQGAGLQGQQLGTQLGEFNAQFPTQVGEFNVGGALQAALANQQAGLQAGGLNISSGLGTQNAILQALGLSPTIAGLPYAGANSIANLLTGGINAGNIPYNVQLTADQLTQQLAQLPFNQTNQRISLASGLALPSTQQTTSVVNPGQTGLIPGLLGSIAGGIGRGIGGSQAVSNALSSIGSRIVGG